MIIKKRINYKNMKIGLINYYNEIVKYKKRKIIMI